MSVCSLHRFHRPKPLRVEQHHIIPQAWQRVWRPERPSPDQWNPSGALWYGRTTALCPTSHSNVHVILVAFMKNAEQLQGNDLERYTQAYSNMKNVYGNTRELRCAAQAPFMWLQAGGPFEILFEFKQYGYGTMLLR